MSLVLAACGDTAADTTTTTTSEPPGLVADATTTTSSTLPMVGPGTEAGCTTGGGELEVQLLVGPAEAVGLEPTAIGSLPFTVVPGPSPNAITGGGSLIYADVLTEQWGTYAVDLDMRIELGGACIAGEEVDSLGFSIEMEGDQMVEVTAEGFHGEYPWSGTATLDLTLPAQEGASAEGEGLAFILHLQA